MNEKTKREPKGMDFIEGYEECLGDISKYMGQRIQVNERAVNGSYLNVVNDVITYLHHLELHISEWYEEHDADLSSLEEEFRASELNICEECDECGEEEDDPPQWMSEMITIIKRNIPDDVQEIKIELSKE